MYVQVDGGAREPRSDHVGALISLYIQTAPYVPVTDWGTPPLSGTPEQLAAELRAYAELGVAHIQIGLEPQTLAGIEALAPVLEAFDRM